jgi:hypothetical protein
MLLRYKTADLHAVTCTIEAIELICIHAFQNNGVNGLYGCCAVPLTKSSGTKLCFKFFHRCA